MFLRCSLCSLSLSFGCTHLQDLLFFFLCKNGCRFKCFGMFIAKKPPVPRLPLATRRLFTRVIDDVFLPPGKISILQTRRLLPFSFRMGRHARTRSPLFSYHNHYILGRPNRVAYFSLRGFKLTYFLFFLKSAATAQITRRLRRPVFFSLQIVLFRIPAADSSPSLHSARPFTRPFPFVNVKRFFFPFSEQGCLRVPFFFLIPASSASSLRFFP